MGFNVPVNLATAFVHAYCGNPDSFFDFFEVQNEEERDCSNDRAITLQAKIAACGLQVFDLVKDKENNKLVDAYAMFRLIYKRFGADALPDRLVSHEQKAGISLYAEIQNGSFNSSDIKIHFGKLQKDSDTILLAGRHYNGSPLLRFSQNGHYVDLSLIHI